MSKKQQRPHWACIVRVNMRQSASNLDMGIAFWGLVSTQCFVHFSLKWSTSFTPHLMWTTLAAFVIAAIRSSVICTDLCESSHRFIKRSPCGGSCCHCSTFIHSGKGCVHHFIIANSLLALDRWPLSYTPGTDLSLQHLDRLLSNIGTLSSQTGGFLSQDSHSRTKFGFTKIFFGFYRYTAINNGILNHQRGVEPIPGITWSILPWSSM